MASMEVEVPDHIRREFEHYYPEEVRDAVFTQILERAIARRKHELELPERRRKAIEAIIELRKSAPIISDEDVQRLRQEYRE